MASLIEKKLSQQPIGVHMELTYEQGGSQHEKVIGILTDNDFSANVEITTETGEEILLGYSIIRGVLVTKSLTDVLKELPAGAEVRFSYGATENREPNLSGIVTENDNEGNLEIKISTGECMILSYSTVRSLLTQSNSKPDTTQPVIPSMPHTTTNPAKTLPVSPDAGRQTGRVPLYQQIPDDTLNVSDSRLQQEFDKMTKDERKRLNGAFDSFKYGTRNNDHKKTLSAAKLARQILYDGADQGYDWSESAVRFCGFLLRRAGQPDFEVFLVKHCFYEAAVSAWKEKRYALSGALSVLALMNGNEETYEDLSVILASSVVNANDASGLNTLYENLPSSFAPHFSLLIQDLFQARNMQSNFTHELLSLIQTLEMLYPEKETIRALNDLLAEGDIEDGGMDSSENEEAYGQEEYDQEEQPVLDDLLHGKVLKLFWSQRTGVILGDDENEYSFQYSDITDASLLKAIESCLRTDLGGTVHLVKFQAEGKTAKQIQKDAALVDRARAIIAENARADRFEVAFEMCMAAINTPDIRRALVDLIKHAITLYNATQDISFVNDALLQYEKNVRFYPNNAFAGMDIAQCYFFVKKYPQMLEHGEKAISIPGLSVNQKHPLLSAYLKMLKEYYEVSGDRALLSRILEKSDDLKESYGSDYLADAQIWRSYCQSIVPYRIFAECGLDMLAEAEADYAMVPDTSIHKAAIDDLMKKTRTRLSPEEASCAPAPDVEMDTPQELYPPEDYSVPEDEEPIVPYADNDGWSALGLTVNEVVDYAIGIDGDARTPAILAYLRTGAALNQEIDPIYQAVALAANDPLVGSDYSLEALMEPLSSEDTTYSSLIDGCMGAAFLRSAFLTGLGHDYTSRGIRDSISVFQHLPALKEACNTLAEFYTEVGRPVDIYADYRNHNVKKLQEDLNATVHHADELYTKFILTPAREGVKFARLLETKKIVFAKDGYLAVMLKRVIDRDQAALEAEKQNFCEKYLSSAARSSNKHISDRAVDDMIMESWDQAGRNMQLKKANATLQGDRRNNLRSNIYDILGTIYQWYHLSEQSAGLTWRTEKGDAAYQRLRPQLIEQLQRLIADCDTETEYSPNAQHSTGLFFIRTAAQELIARLDGSWKINQEKYLYADFLRENFITLNQDFTPELASTFCVLPEFNILARIRCHVEGEKRSYQEQINRIFGTDRTCNNYGTAERILEYLAFLESDEEVQLPENAELFIEHTEMQIDMRYRSFRETYALAMNYGQIIKSDAFCYTLEDTVRYWYSFCRESKNYGFFTSILAHAEEQIHASARQYEAQLDEQLDALIASNQSYFDSHPDYAEAIRAQIVNQNFTVAEDWMSRIRIGDFSLEVQQPEALRYLEGFWNNYAITYNRVSDTSRDLHSLLKRREVRNKDTKRAQQLIENWLNNGNPSSDTRIEQLLNLLGWRNIHVEPYHFAGDSRLELYTVRKESSSAGLVAPLHPIAAFGSSLEMKEMYIFCLYGNYSCDGLYEKIRILDCIDGNKVILLDCALGQADRRALAQKLKQRESGLRNVYIVIDRVLITHLADNYNENLVNRILMAIAMPFSYCQPYVVESTLTMPPEIFIGRKDELLKIEQADGVNLIYGGRQLGKSALFKKAKADIDGHQGQRAVHIELTDLNCAAAAHKTSAKLIDAGLLPETEETSDWDELCRSIERRLRNTEDEISYFLLMLDEADTFIDDCANYKFHPLVALKDIQQSLPGRFKYVLAGLHNIVKFNRQVALGNNSVITHIPSLKITPFHTPEAQELLTIPLSYLGLSLPSKVTVSQILATCNYFPGLIQLYAKKLIESIRSADYAGYDVKRTPPYVVSDEHLRRVMSDKEFVDQIHEKFEITLTLDPYYFPLTLLIGWMYTESPSKNGYTAKTVLSYAQDLMVRQLKDLDVEKIEALMFELLDLNILRSVSNNSFLLASKNFRDLLGSETEILQKLDKLDKEGEDA